MTESSNPEKILPVKGRVLLAATSFAIGIIIFIVSYAGMKQQIGLGKLNQPILSWMVGHRSPVVTDTAKIITSVASPYFFASIVGLIVICWIIIKHEIWRPVALAGAVAIAAITSTLLKTVFMDARPPQIDMIPAFEYDFSFPSGHTIGMAVFLLIAGYLIYSRHYSIGRFWTWITVAIIGTSLVAFSRLYLGYHWLTDVVASVGLALIILAIVIVVDTFFIQKYKSKQFFSNIDR
jgi:undecaprenyl-diphosphatase